MKGNLLIGDAEKAYYITKEHVKKTAPPKKIVITSELQPILDHHGT
ncbi:MAG: hypothetical protein ABFS09_13505 [Thermodesulfobacteriota bacterium]